MKYSTFCQVVCEILIIITYSSAKKYVILIFSSWSKGIFSHFSKLIVLKYNFNKVACNFIEIALQRRCSPVNFLHIIRTRIYNNTSGGLLLNSKRFEKTFISLCSIQGGLSKKEIQLNLCNIFSIFIFNELYLFI